VEVLEEEAPNAHTDLTGELTRFVLARPTLYALAKEPLRYVDLATALVGATGSAVHFRTLDRALSFLLDVGLITRHDRSPRKVVYELSQFGRDLIKALDAIDRLAEMHQKRNCAGPIGDDT
jgi:DNA-binding HxlR family transcriptional regulator